MVLMSRESKNRFLALFFTLKCKFFVKLIKKPFTKRLWHSARGGCDICPNEKLFLN